MRTGWRSLKGFFVWLWCCLAGCGAAFTDTTVHGVPNLSSPAPRIWGMGQPTDGMGWEYVKSIVAPDNRPVLVIKLDDAVEGDDSYVANLPNFSLLDAHMPPEDDKPWTVAVAPPKDLVNATLDKAALAYRNGVTLIFHCKHGRDRTRFMIALLMRRLFGWTKEQGWDYMLAHGFRWELPDLDFYYWIETTGAPSM